MRSFTGNKCTIEEALRWASSCFAAAGLERPRDEAEILLAQLQKRDRLKIFLERAGILEEKAAAAFAAAVERRLRGEPLAYIVGRKEFYGLEFTVNREVLIPRPDTEHLVDAVLEWVRGRERDICGLDLGCGSGNLAVTLAFHLPQAVLYAVDISAGALQVAQANAARHGVVERLRFCRGDYFEALRGIEPPPRFNLVVANPPYIATAEIETLPAAIRDYEPRAALDGGSDGLEAYRRILKGAPPYLRGPGLMALEIGADQGDAVLALCRDSGLFHTLTLHRDYSGRPRVVLGLY
ncbi:MAG: peptide chain release factor N(5)-glutamine methyltransferase [Firmicutes bacterium]|nr:peptide chain release factor N(5)-glutamine methyltransferase [Bacillota bacterium]HPU00592.1 peptide chain release factor N(5)-glutamine methyltransferase [Bacillota bacterium]